MIQLPRANAKTGATPRSLVAVPICVMASKVRARTRGVGDRPHIDRVRLATDGGSRRSCDASGAARSTRGMDPAAIELHSAEFLAVDVETNGRAGDDCELTEVGAVLVGGGELHEEFESLVRVERPLSRGIERLTGITQAMVDAAPAPAEALSRLDELVRGRVLVAHSAQFDRRALMQGFERAGLPWPNPPVLCPSAMPPRYAPLPTQRSLA